MHKKIFILTVIFLIFLSGLTAAVSLDDFDKELLVKVFKNLDTDELDYMARLGLNSEDISLILYYYSSTGRELDRDDLDRLSRHRNRLDDFHVYFGMPPILFEDDIVRFRHPYRERHFPPLDVKKYDKRYDFKHGYEKVEVRGNNYKYYYRNKKYNIEEKIEVKNKKYEFQYKDRNMIEMMEVNYANYKYHYYYKNLRTGKTIKKEGRGRPLNRDSFYRELKENYRDKDYYDDDDDDYDDDYDDDKDGDSHFQFEVKIDLNDLLD
ncbi:MAG: hypothetical protein ACQESS_04510 [Bacillota bacterium]